MRGPSARHRVRQNTAADPAGFDALGADPPPSSASAVAASCASRASSAERVVAAGCTSSLVITAMSFTASESAGSVIATSSSGPTNATGTAR